MGWIVGIDVGGTFTDLIGIEPAAGKVALAKVPTTLDNQAFGVLGALEKGGIALGDAETIVHGTTTTTNALLERKVARVGLITTKGFRDSLEIRRGIRTNAWDHRRPFPPVLVPRYLRLPVGGRIDRHGKEMEPLCLADIDAER